VPIAFMGGIAEQWFAPFALTIASSVLVSLFVSFSLDPMLSAYWPDPHLAERDQAWITRTLGRFNRWFDRQAERYKSLIGWALDHRWSMVALAAVRPPRGPADGGAVRSAAGCATIPIATIPAGGRRAEGDAGPDRAGQ
jgi:hypothetical protein